tara:strand:- start:584 stop:904 length:321 start_codon:yes stop_codon:yes gene_type:complete
LISKKYYKRILSLLLVLNLWDAIATSTWVINGYAIEANPLMAVLLDIGPGLFILIKTLLVMLCICLLWRLKPRPLSVLLLIPVCILYIYVSIVHVFAFFAITTGVI